MKEKKTVSAAGSGFGRREFGQRAALALTGAALAGAPFSGVARGFAMPLAPDSAEQQEDAQGLSTKAQAEIESKLQHIFATYGSRLNDDQRKLLRRTVTYHVRMLEAVRPIAVANGDAPATVLKLVERQTQMEIEQTARSSKSRGTSKSSKREE